MAILAAWPSILTAQTARRELRVGIAGVPPTVEPAGAVGGAVPLIARQLFDTLLVYRDGSTDVMPALATRWSVSRDGLVWSFTLRDGVRFHDGTALTAAEVATAFERLRSADQAHASPVWSAVMRGTPGVVKEVRAADPRTVQFVLLQPYAALLSGLAHPGLGIARQVAGPDGSARFVGTGPYRLAEVTAGRVAMDAVAGHWSGSARAERIVVLEVGSDDHAEAEMAGGGLDLWFAPGPPRRADWALSVPGTRVGYVAFQTEKEPFSRKKIRQALATALEPAVLGVALGRTAVPLQSFLPPGVWGRREGSAIMGGTREAVARLLEEGGWPRGYAPTLLLPQDIPGLDTKVLADAIQLTLEAVNIRLRLRVEADDAVRTALAVGDHDLALAEASVVAGDPHLFLYPLSTSEGASRGPGMTNFSFFRNARVDDLLIRASQLGFRPERQRLYQRAQAVLAEELPWLPLYVRLVWAVARPEVRGLRLHPTGYHRLSTVALEGWQ